MNNETDLMELADELVEIAGSTDDAETGRLLMMMVHRLLTCEGLPLVDDLLA